MTRKMYYENGYTRTFAAHVTSCTQKEDLFEVTLDRTCFYPEGGGQAADIGTLGDARVLDVQERGEEVIHLCDRALEPDTLVNGTIDWERRFDLMQQHTGEHMVSGVIHSRYGYHNVGFHMGSVYVTIDFDGPIPPEDLPEIEAAVNQAVWRNVPILVKIPDREELPKEVYRSKRELPWPVRIVSVLGVDSCACCGIHVSNAAEVGLVKLFSCVKFHQGVRIEMACGRRALQILNGVYAQNKVVSQEFSAKIMETGDAAKKMNERLAAAEYRIVQLERQMYRNIAEKYAGQGDVVHFQENLTPVGVRELAEQIGDLCGGTAAVFSPTGDGHAVCLVNRGGSVKELGQAMNAALNGRGGGKPGYFQGSVKADREEILEFMDKQR